MSLPVDVVTQFIKATNDDTQKKNESTVYATIVEYEGSKWARIDGSDRLTPITTTTDIEPDERVIVTIKNHSAIVTGNLSSPSARTGDLEETDGKVTELTSDYGEFKKLTVDDLKAINGEFDNLSADYGEFVNLTAENFKAVNGEFDKISAAYGEFEDLTVGRLDAAEANIGDLQANSLTADSAVIKNLQANSLTADSAVIKNLESDVADIDTLIFGTASGGSIQTSFANAVIAQLGNAQIKSAMIDNVSASKITAGNIITNNVQVKSEDGSLLISDETIQISDDARVRVQIGKDASNDYSINIWDANGKLMFSEGGITDSAIKNAIIRNDMVSDNANISASKLDISSLFTEINGSKETIKSSKINMDADGQTLDIAFTSMSSDVNDLSNAVNSQGTALSVVQGQINSKIWKQDISELEDVTEELTTQYSELNQTVNGISTTVSSHTTQISNKADSSTVTSVSDRVSKVETDLSGFKSTVSSTYATKTDLSSADAKAANAATAASNAQKDADALETRMTTAETAIDQNSDAIKLRATKTELTNVNNKFGSYYTKTETNSAITAEHNKITSEVSASYATKDALSSAESRITQTEKDIKSQVSVTNGLETRTSSLEQTATDFTIRFSTVEGNVSTANTNASNAVKTANTAKDTANTANTNASAAVNTANTANNNASSAVNTANAAKDTANTANNNASSAVGTANTANTNASTAVNTANAAKSTAENAATAASNAAKTATNYLNFSNDGLVVGDMTSNSLGKNVLIDSDSVDIRNGTSKLASFSGNQIDLGITGGADTTINLCGSNGWINMDSNDEALQLYGKKAVSLVSDETIKDVIDGVTSDSEYTAHVKVSSYSNADHRYISLFTQNYHHNASWLGPRGNYASVKLNSDGIAIETGGNASSDPNTGIYLQNDSIHLTTCTYDELQHGTSYTQIYVLTPSFVVEGDLGTNGDLITNGTLYIGRNAVVDYIVEQGIYGVWTYKKWNSGTCELWGSVSVSNLNCNIALGSMYRTAEVVTPDYPFAITSPNVVSSYESQGYGSILWPTGSTTTATSPTNYYLVRPTSTTIVTGTINLQVKGKWK